MLASDLRPGMMFKFPFPGSGEGAHIVDLIIGTVVDESSLQLNLHIMRYDARSLAWKALIWKAFTLELYEPDWVRIDVP